MLKFQIFLVLMMLSHLSFAEEFRLDAPEVDEWGTVSNGVSGSISEATVKSESTINSKSEAKIESPPPSAISPSISTSNSDLCTVGVSGAVQTQILGLSTGATVRDMNCERLKNAKVMYDMGMKVAAVSIMCQDDRIFQAMWMSGTPCPYEGKIGDEATELWLANPDKMPANIELEERRNDTLKGAATGFSIASLLFLLL